MKTPRWTLLGLCALACSDSATLEPEIMTLVATPDSAAPGDEVALSASLRNMSFTGGDAHDDDDMHGDDNGDDNGDDDMHDDGDDSGTHDNDNDDGDELVGHIHVYFDNLTTNPVVQMLNPESSFIVPIDATPGAHMLIGRIHNADHSIYEPEVTLEVPFEVLSGN